MLKLPAATFGIAAPLSTHWVPATCEQVGCEQYLNGWAVRVEGLPEQMLYDATHSGRSYRIEKVAPGHTLLVFAAGQPCFRASQHRRRVTDRQEIYTVSSQGGRRGPLKPTSARLWVEEFSENQDRIQKILRRG
jgi:hypothetical protein